jgi:hypothetical protein
MQHEEKSILLCSFYFIIPAFDPVKASMLKKRGAREYPPSLVFARVSRQVARCPRDQIVFRHIFVAANPLAQKYSQGMYCRTVRSRPPAFMVSTPSVFSRGKNRE